MYLTERMVIVLALKSFEGFTEGELATVWMSERIANLIANHYLRLMQDPLWEVNRGHKREDQPS